MWEKIGGGVAAWGKALASQDPIPAQDSAWFRRVAQARLAVWLAVLVATCLAFHRYMPASVEVASLGTLLSLAVLFRAIWPGREISNSKIDAFLTDDLVAAVAAGADLLFGVLLIHACGSFRSPFLLLLPVCVGEGYALFGAFGASTLCLLAVTTVLFRFHPAAALGAGVLTTASLLEWTRSRIFLPVIRTEAPSDENTQELEAENTEAGAAANIKIGETAYDLPGEAPAPPPETAPQKLVRLLMSFPPISSAAPVKARPLAPELEETVSSLPMVSSLPEETVSSLEEDTQVTAAAQPSWLPSETQEIAPAPALSPQVEDQEAWDPPAVMAERQGLERAIEQLLETVVAVDGEADARDLYARILSIVLDLLEAESGALWLEESRKLTVQAAERSVAVALSAEPIDVWPVETLRERSIKRLRLADRSATAPIAVLLTRSAGGTGKADEVLGLIGICAPRERVAFSPEDAARLETLAASLTAAVRSVEQRARLQQRVRETTLLYEMNQRLQDLTDVEAIGPAVVAQAQRALGAEDSTLFLMDPEGRYVEPKATEGRLVNLIEHLTFPAWPGISGWIQDGAKPLFLPILEREPRLTNAEVILPFVRSFLAAPLRIQGRLVGFLTACHPQSGAFTADDMRLLTLLAEQAACSIERTEAFQTLETLALTDELTQVYNHRYFQVRLEDELRRGEHHDTAASILMIDLDNFKEVNDRYGHISGDRILHDFAALLRQSVRASEIITRYGGDEFALILPSTEYEPAQLVAERLRSAIAGHTFETADGHPVHLTLSLGLASYPQHGVTRSELVARADRALYAAKRNGGNQVGPDVPSEPNASSEADSVLDADPQAAADDDESDGSWSVAA